MGTRADFYMDRGYAAKWLGSVAYDGYPDDFDRALLACREATDWLRRVAEMLDDRDDATLPAQGWPWDDSKTTDFAYAYEDARVYVSRFGGPWQVATEFDEDKDAEDDSQTAFPDMSARKNVAFGSTRSGLIVVSERVR